MKLRSVVPHQGDRIDVPEAVKHSPKVFGVNSVKLKPMPAQVARF